MDRTATKPARPTGAGWAHVSPDGTYRYALGRQLGSGRGGVNWIMLNPSTATAEADDPTIRRVKAFSRAWGYASCVVTNLFAYRATDPFALGLVADPVGPQNDHFIRQMATEAAAVVVAWGVHGARRGRDAAVLALLADLGARPVCLGVTRGGHPKHPLYCRADLAPVVFPGAGR